MAEGVSVSGEYTSTMFHMALLTFFDFSTKTFKVPST